MEPETNTLFALPKQLNCPISEGVLGLETSKILSSSNGTAKYA